MTGVKRDALVIAVYLAITVAVTHPLWLHFRSAIPGGGDSWLYYWNLWWIRRAIVDLGTSPFFTHDLYHPYGASLYFHTLNLAGGLLALPLLRVTTIATSYNTLVLLSFVLSAYGTYRLIIDILGGSAWQAAVIGGAVFAFSTFRFAHLLGHLDLISTQWIPFFLLCLLRLTAGRSWWYVVPAGVCFALAALTTPYFLLCLGLIAAAVLVDRPASWRRVLATSAVGLLLMSPVLVPMIINGTTQGRSASPVADAERFSPDVLAFVVPSSLHSIWGRAALGVHRALQPQGLTTETLVYVGFVALVLAIVGMPRCPRRRLWLWLAGGAFVLALGPTVRIAGHAIPLIGRLAPYRLILHLPYGDIPRVPARFDVVLMLAVAVLAARGAQRVMDRYRWGPMAAVVLLAAVVLDNLIAPIPLNAVEAPPFFAQLAAAPAGALLEIPIPDDPATFPRRMLWQTNHGKPVFGGYLARGLPPLPFDAIPGFGQFKSHSGHLDDVVDYDPDDVRAASVTALNYYRTRILALEKRLMPPADLLRVQRTADEIVGADSRFYDDDTVVAYHVPPSPTLFSPVVWLDRGWSYLERLAPAAGLPIRWHWMGDSAQLVVVAPQRGSASLQLTAQSYGKPRRIQLLSADRVIATFLVPTRQADFEAAEIPLPAGPTVLTLHSVDGSDSPDGDARRLSIALFRLRVTASPARASRLPAETAAGRDKPHS